MKPSFFTTEFYLVCLLHAMEIKLLGVNKQGRVYIFEFNDAQNCNEIRQKLVTKDVVVNAADFVNSIRVIKDLIFSSSEEHYNVKS